MGDTQHHPHQAPSSRLGLRAASAAAASGGEIVEVEGGHIVRSTGRKDRHSKVCTAKGPRDRRVRLAAHTAIQFYDVQDRLGYDRPSKAVDWLIKKAKPAIDELAELPAWNPLSPKETTSCTNREARENRSSLNIRANVNVGTSSSRGATMATAAEDGGGDAFRCDNSSQQEQLIESMNNGASFLPPSLDSDAIGDTIKSFFPIGASVETTSSMSIQFENYAPDLLSRTSSQSQDLRLSLQSFQEPILLHPQSHHHHHHHHHHHQQSHDHENEQAIFTGAASLGFEAPPATAAAGVGWSEHHLAEISRLQRMVAWNTSVETGGSSGGGGFIFSSPPSPQPPLPPPLQPLFGHSQLFSQRGPLQSSNTPSVRAWIDPSPMAAMDNLQHQTLPVISPSFISGTGFPSGGFSGFRIPARIRGEEEHDGLPNKPSSASSNSRH